MIGSNTQNSVCSIKFLIFLRFMCGYYHDMNASKRVKLLAKLYCLLVFSLLSYVHYSHYVTYGLHLYKSISSFSEYLTYILFSAVTKNSFLFDYYRCTNIDMLPQSKKLRKKLEKSLKGLIFVMLSLRVINLMLFCGSWPWACIELYMFVVNNVVMAHTAVMGTLSMLMVFALLYTRVKAMRKILECNGFHNTPAQRFGPQRYIQMYETIVDTMAKINRPLKLMLLINLICSLPHVLTELFNMFTQMNEWGPNLVSALWFLTSFLYEHTPLIGSAVMFDLVTENMEAIKVLVLEKRIACKNERERDEIQKLYLLLKQQPLTFKLCRVVPLNVHSLLTFLSFCTTTMIAILQINRISA